MRLKRLFNTNVNLVQYYSWLTGSCCGSLLIPISIFHTCSAFEKPPRCKPAACMPHHCLHAGGGGSSTMDWTVSRCGTVLQNCVNWNGRLYHGCKCKAPPGSPCSTPIPQKFARVNHRKNARKRSRYLRPSRFVRLSSSLYVIARCPRNDFPLLKSSSFVIRDFPVMTAHCHDLSPDGLSSYLSSPPPCTFMAGQLITWHFKSVNNWGSGGCMIGLGLTLSGQASINPAANRKLRPETWWVAIPAVNFATTCLQSSPVCQDDNSFFADRGLRFYKIVFVWWRNNCRD